MRLLSNWSPLVDRQLLRGERAARQVPIAEVEGYEYLTWPDATDARGRLGPLNLLLRQALCTKPGATCDRLVHDLRHQAPSLMYR